MIQEKIRIIASLFLFLPFDLIVTAAILLTDVITFPRRLLRRTPPRFPPADCTKVTFQILNWDGKHLLQECLPSVVEAAGTRHDVLVVDNGSSDGSMDFVRSRFPGVRILELDRNYGFSIGNNRGFAQVSTDIVVVLNNDMIVDREFLNPLLAPFRDPSVFAVTSRIAFPDPSQRLVETGKTGAEFEKGFFRMWHDPIAPDEESVESLTVFWAGGGSSAIDRRKLLALGGFDTLYHPFYVEDVDLSYQATKRGWKSLLAPGSRVTHKHRGTSRRKFGDAAIDCIIRRNGYLFIWKNVTEPGMTLSHLLQLPRIHARSIMQSGARFEFQAYFSALLRFPLALWRRIQS